uniref:hypothetical protein n=1 Tax=Streptomyces sp. 14R-10 TaxID=1442159 RepID=UPI001E5A259B|nr:hypothetical protein [Streptomyces sp. 14R-10]
MRDDQHLPVLTTAQEARDALTTRLREGESLDQPAAECGFDLQHVLERGEAVRESAEADS